MIQQFSSSWGCPAGNGPDTCSSTSDGHIIDAGTSVPTHPSGDGRHVPSDTDYINMAAGRWHGSVSLDLLRSLHMETQKALFQKLGTAGLLLNLWQAPWNAIYSTIPEKSYETAGNGFLYAQRKSVVLWYGVVCPSVRHGLQLRWDGTS